MTTINILGKRVLLTPFLKSDTPIVLGWRNSERYLNFCSKRKNTVNLDEFNRELTYDFSRDRHLQYLIKRVSDKKPVGTIFSYGLNKIDNYVFVTTFITKEHEKSFYGVEGHALFIQYLFHEFNMQKIYADVYSYNELSLNIMLRSGYCIESRFKKHRSLPDKSKYDLIRLALNRSSYGLLDDFVNKLVGINVSL